MVDVFAEVYILFLFWHMLLKVFFVLDTGAFILQVLYITVFATNPMTQGT